MNKNPMFLPGAQVKALLGGKLEPGLVIGESPNPKEPHEEGFTVLFSSEDGSPRLKMWFRGSELTSLSEASKT